MLWLQKMWKNGGASMQNLKLENTLRAPTAAARIDEYFFICDTWELHIGLGNFALCIE